MVFQFTKNPTTGKYGYKDSNGNFVPFRTTHTSTYTASSRGAALDMGEDHTYRYVNTNGVPNTNSGTYTPTSRNASLDMGATNTYRYVNTNSVPNTNSGTYTVNSNGTKDMGETNTNRYVSVSVNQTPSFSWRQVVDGTTSTTTVSCKVGDIIIVQRGDNAGAASVSNANHIGTSHRNDNVYYYRATSTSVTVTTGMYYTTIGVLSWSA